MPMDRSRYPDNWEEISIYIRFTRTKDGGGTWAGKRRLIILYRNQNET